MHWLATLETLAASEKARLTLVSDAGRPRVTWKQKGRRLEVIESHVVEGLQGLAAALVTRLGYGNLPTPDNIVERMTPGQKVRLRALVADIQALKREVMAQTPIVEVEPDFAVPSSLSGERRWR